MIRIVGLSATLPNYKVRCHTVWNHMATDSPQAWLFAGSQDSTARVTICMFSGFNSSSNVAWFPGVNSSSNTCMF